MLTVGMSNTYVCTMYITPIHFIILSGEVYLCFRHTWIVDLCFFSSENSLLYDVAKSDWTHDAQSFLNECTKGSRFLNNDAYVVKHLFHVIPIHNKIDLTCV